MKIAYIIASCSGNDSRNINPEEIPQQKDYIKIHLRMLAQTNLSLISKIFIGNPKTNCPVSGFYDFPIEIEKYKEKIEIIGLINKNQSYGQYISIFQKYPNYDYYIIVEDDYYPAIYNFVEILTNIHKQKLPNGGYLCSFKDYHQQGILHAAISNGIIDKKSFQESLLGHPDPMAHYKEKLINKGLRTCPQITFSTMFENIEDFSNEYDTFFWCSGKSFKKIRTITKNKNSPVFKPIQMFKD